MTTSFKKIVAYLGFSFAVTMLLNIMFTFQGPTLQINMIFLVSFLLLYYSMKHIGPKTLNSKKYPLLVPFSLVTVPYIYVQLHALSWGPALSIAVLSGIMMYLFFFLTYNDQEQ